ncbi:MAG: helix-turn-helix domain-containing protein [Alsobacter sp.]
MSRSGSILWLAMRSEDADHVLRLPLFQSCTPAVAERLVQMSFLQRFPTGVLLTRQGTRPDFLHVVVEGAAELFATYHASEATVAVLRPHAVFPLESVIADDPQLNSGRTLDASKILMVPAEPVRAAITSDAGFAAAVARELAGTHRLAVRELQSQKLRTSLERLANWILITRRDQGETTAITLPFQKRTLASLIGTSPENLSRNFQALTEHGVEIRGSRLVITDVDALVNLARPSPELDDIPHES